VLGALVGFAVVGDLDVGADEGANETGWLVPGCVVAG